jgi:hypothetical protein
MIGVDQNLVGHALGSRDFLGVSVLLDDGDICDRASSLVIGIGVPRARTLAQQDGERQRDQQHDRDLWERRQPCLCGLEGKEHYA